MAGLPPVSLGANILAAFGATLVLRRSVETRWVEAVDPIRRPSRQFRLDFCLGLLAGLIAAMLNILRHGFPAASTISLLSGVLCCSFFLALDLALARERQVIRAALSAAAPRPAPARLYPMTRKFTWMALASAVLVAIVILMVLSRDMVWLTRVGTEPRAVAEAVLSISYEIVFIMAVLLALTVNLIISYSRNLKLLFENQTGVLESVSRGDLSRMVPVATRDEFGLIAGHTNSMIEGLRHRSRLVSALKLAEEVQRNLLPSQPPQVPGLEICGTSLYCDETGGDYYDFLRLPGGRLGVVVADVSGHGIDAALFMASARAFLISEARNFTGPAPLLEAVNRYLALDGASTGRFMSMFFLEVDPAAKTLRWVRAGHEPAVMFEPAPGRFTELGGDGLALGVVETLELREYSRRGWPAGAVVVIGTDGVSETRNPSNALFGPARLREIIRRHAAGTAAEIQAAVIAAVAEFRGEAPQEDDVTLVVLKMTA
jgi:sigma-B regulation protein RsbU (phosphoserine phosphatase)